MNGEFPSYLKLHVEEAADQADVRTQSPALAALCERFQEATGWPLQFADECQVALGSEPQRKDAIAVDVAEQLSETIAQVLAEYQHTQTALWHREAELAAGVPVVRREDEEEHLAVRLESAIRGGAEAIGCQAAALYLLDDATSELKLRSAWGLPAERYREPARPLRGSYADLEALVGHAVVLEDTGQLPHWKVPEDFPSAVCVPVSSPTTPLGTLWMFCDRKRDFSTTETDLIEIVAGRLASDLEREVLLQETTKSNAARRQLNAATLWLENRLPHVTPVLNDWQVAGWSSQLNGVGGAFHDWSITRQGLLSVTAGHAGGKMIEAALTAASVLGAVRTHDGYASAPRQILGEVNEMLWAGSSGDQFASVCHAHVDPESGRVEMALSAGAAALHVTTRSAKPFASCKTALGEDGASQFKGRRATLKPGDLLVLFGAAPQRDAKTWTERMVDHAKQITDRSADNVAEEFRGALLSVDSSTDQSIVVVRRRP